MFNILLEPIFNNEGSSIKIDHELNLTEFEFIGTHPFKSPVLIKGEVKNNTGIVSLKAEASFTLSTACDRCTKDIAKEFTVPIDHILVTELNDEDNDEFLVVEGMRIDLDELATEDIILYLPTKFLCSEDCKGLCPTCGKNLNEDSCSCEKPIDPRLEVLRQLLDK